MPIIKDVSLTLSAYEVMCRMGVKEDGIFRHKLEVLKDKLLEKIAHSDLLKPAVAYGIRPIIERHEHQIRFQVDPS